ncbi:expressed unknown protein (Partial), partial [Seminavis robusta]|eukprot:Sro2558_g331240.1 n/a (215) ;mRNA; f:13042-13687
MSSKAATSDSDPAATAGYYRLHQGNRQISKQPMTAQSSESFTQLLFQNERIQVYDFRLPPGESVTVVHELPTIRWQVDEGHHGLVVTQPPQEGGHSSDKKEEDEIVPDRKVFFVSPGTQWTLKNIAASTAKETGTYRQILFVLQSDEPKYSEQQVQDLLKEAIYTTAVGTALLLENELCRVWDFYLEPGEGGGSDTVHHHCLDYVFINVAPSRLL